MSITTGTVLKIVATLLWTDGNIMQNVFAAVVTGGGGPFDEDDIVADAVEWVGDLYADLTGQISDHVDGSEVTVYQYDAVDEDFDEVGSDAWVFNPTGAGEYLPQGVAALINCKTTDPDVSGKKYIGGLAEADIADGAWTSGMLAKLVLTAATWLTGFVGGTSGADYQPGVWSPTNLNFYAASGTAVIPSIASYQRRRKPGVGI